MRFSSSSLGKLTNFIHVLRGDFVSHSHPSSFTCRLHIDGFPLNAFHNENFYDFRRKFSISNSDFSNEYEKEEESGFWQHKQKNWDDEMNESWRLPTSDSTSVPHNQANAYSNPILIQNHNPYSNPTSQSSNQRIDSVQTEGLSEPVRLMNDEEESSPIALQTKSSEFYIPVKAFYIARNIDLKGMLEGPCKSFLHHPVRNNVIIRYPDQNSYSINSEKTAMNNVPVLNERYMVAFQYGAVVFFNFHSREQQEILDSLTPYCTDRFKEARKDDYGVVLRPSLAGWSDGGSDHIMVKRLDTNNIRVISSVLGQSVALEFYAKKVDEMVNTFSELNRGMEDTGTFTMKRKKLFQLVAAANTTLADVILRLGLLERSDTAWKYAHYARIWEYMRDDFELDERFESLDFKLNIIQHNVRFFLDILQNRKSDTLEWIIIILISGEIFIGLYEIVHTAMKTNSNDFQSQNRVASELGLQ